MCSQSTFPARVLRSALVSRHLLDEGYGVLAFEAHSAGATWDDEGEAAIARIFAAFEYISRHVKLRYCRVALFAADVGATAAFVAVARALTEPKLKLLVESRLKVICAYEPTLERHPDGDGDMVLDDTHAGQSVEQLEAQLLSECIPRTRAGAPVVLVARPSRSTSTQLPKWHTLHRLLDLSSDVPCQVFTTDGSDDLEYFSERPDELLDHLHTHLGGKRDLYEQRLLVTTPRARLSPRNPLPTSPPRAIRLPGLNPRGHLAPVQMA